MPKQVTSPPLQLERAVLKRFPMLPTLIEDARARYGEDELHHGSGAILKTIGHVGLHLTAHDSTAIPVVTLWRESRVIYQYDPDLADVLMAQDSPDIPCDTLHHLPQWCTCITGFDRAGKLVALYAAVEYGILCLTWQHASGLVQMDALPLGEGDAGQTFARVMDALEDTLPQGMVDQYKRKARARINRGVNLLLYLCADNAELHTSHPRPPRVSTPRDPAASARPTRPLTYDVGVRIGAAIRTAQHDAEAAAGQLDRAPSASRTSPTPHVRRGHYATYWTGSGRKVPIVRWIEPLLIGVRKADSGITTTVRPVQGAPDKEDTDE